MKKYYIIIMIFLSVASAFAQATKTSYFMDNATMSHTLNPAFAPRKGYVGMPFLSGININAVSNFGYSNFVYPLSNSDKLGTFLHPEVSADKFLAALPEVSSMGEHLGYDVFSMGWYSSDFDFWTVDVGFRTNGFLNIPKEFFSFAKNQMSSSHTEYLIEDLNFNQDAYVTAGVGFAHQFPQVPGLSVGGKIKLYVPMASVDMNINYISIDMTEESWKINSDAQGVIMGKGVDFVLDEDKNITSLKFEPSQLGLAGFGFGIDLGAEYRLTIGSVVDGLTFSASVTDLGAMFFSKNGMMQAGSNGAVDFDGFGSIDLDDLDVNKEIELLKEELFTLAAFSPEKVTAAPARKLTTNVYVGIEYPFINDMMSVGVLYSGKFAKYRSAHDVTFSYNIVPVDWFGFSLSYSVLEAAQSFGFMLNFTPNKGVNFFIASDYMNYKFSPQFVPIDKINMSFMTGISFPFGRDRMERYLK